MARTLEEMLCHDEPNEVGPMSDYSRGRMPDEVARVRDPNVRWRMMLAEEGDPQSFVAEAADRDAKEMIMDPELFCYGCFKRTTRGIWVIGDVEYFADKIAQFAGLDADVALAIATLRFQAVELTATVPLEEVRQPLRVCPDCAAKTGTKVGTLRLPINFDSAEYVEHSQVWELQVCAEVAFAKSRGWDDWEPDADDPDRWDWVNGYIVRYAGRNHEHIDLASLVRPEYPDDAPLVPVTGRPPTFRIHEPVLVREARQAAKYVERQERR